jgi:hypothetical protein
VAKKKMDAVAVPWTDLRELFGLADDDAKVKAVLGRSGKVTWTKPDGGARYAIAKEAGFDLLVQRAERGKRGSPMVVNTIFLYGEGAKHRKYAAAPYGLAFSTRAELLASMPRPERTWKIGEGKVPLETKGVSHDRWLIDELWVSADYDAEEGVRSIVASVPGQA